MSSSTSSAISVRGFGKTFRGALFKRPTVGAADVTFEVQRGEVYGFLGPNGAGKTTTIKALLGLIRPDAGELQLLGHPVDDGRWREHVGYLPEHPTFYDYLTGFEMVTWFGQLSGLSPTASKEAATRLLKRVGLHHAMHKRLRSYSKGMLQRAGLAQAIVASPHLLILDEPMTGLDPLGRKEIRELILDLSAEGCTVFYSTHILPDVEMTCDRVCILDEGRSVRTGRISDILSETTLGVEVVVSGLSPEAADRIREGHPESTFREGFLEVLFVDAASARDFIATLPSETKLERFQPHRDDLEQIFVRSVRSSRENP